MTQSSLVKEETQFHLQARLIEGAFHRNYTSYPLL